ncbi:MAG: hypothetical protein ABWZ56_04000 [Flavobacterium sp.]
MKIKNFLLAGIAGGIADFLLGWLLYGIVFKDYFPSEMPNMLFIFLGCMTFGFFISYIFIQWASISNYLTGLKAGAMIGIFIGLMTNFFMRASSMDVDYQNFGIDLVIGIVMGALVGAVVAAVNGKL